MARYSNFKHLGNTLDEDDTPLRYYAEVTETFYEAAGVSSRNITVFYDIEVGYWSSIDSDHAVSSSKLNELSLGFEELVGYDMFDSELRYSTT